MKITIDSTGDQTVITVTSSEETVTITIGSTPGATMLTRTPVRAAKPA